MGVGLAPSQEHTIYLVSQTLSAVIKAAASRIERPHLSEEIWYVYSVYLGIFVYANANANCTPRGDCPMRPSHATIPDVSSFPSTSTSFLLFLFGSSLLFPSLGSPFALLIRFEAECEHYLVCSSHLMSLLALPPELVCMVARHLHSLAAISALMQTNRWLYQLIRREGFLYDRVPSDRRDALLLRACADGTEDLAHAMLRRGANPTADTRHNKLPEDIRSSIEYAADQGHAVIVQMILDRDARIFTADTASYTLKRAFDRAIFKGQAEVVKVILNQSKKITPENTRGFKPARFTSQFLKHGLNFALRDGQEGIVDALLADDRMQLIEWNLPAAVTGGNENLVRRCLKDLPYSMPNYVACMEKAADLGHVDALRAILEVDGVDPNIAIGYSQPPLLVATKQGHEKIVKVLLERADTQPELKDPLGWTPFAIAARKGFRGIMELLWNTGRVNAEWSSAIGQTPLSLAAEAGHEDVVSFLLSIEGIGLDRPDIRGRTPLSLAAGAGVAGVAKRLLDTGHVDPNSRDSDGQSPLAWAVLQGFPMRVSSQRDMQLARDEKEILNLLKGTEPAGIAPPSSASGPTKDQDRRTKEAIDRGLAVLNCLLAREDIDPDSRDNHGDTPLSYAVRYRNIEAVRLLLSTGKVNADNKDINGRVLSDWIKR